MTRFADWLPEPLTVPTRIARSLTDMGDDAAPSVAGYASTTERVDDMMCLSTSGAATTFSFRARVRRARRTSRRGSLGERSSEPCFPNISHSITSGRWLQGRCRFPRSCVCGRPRKMAGPAFAQPIASRDRFEPLKRMTWRAAPRKHVQDGLLAAAIHHPEQFHCGKARSLVSPREGRGRRSLRSSSRTEVRNSRTVLISDFSISGTGLVCMASGTIPRTVRSPRHRVSGGIQMQADERVRSGSTREFERFTRIIGFWAVNSYQISGRRDFFPRRCSLLCVVVERTIPFSEVSRRIE